MYRDYKMKAVLINETYGNIIEIELDIHPKKNEVFKLLKGTGTFVGQWPDSDVVIMKCKESIFELQKNENTLVEPFDKEVIYGPILFIRMDENADHQDLTLTESLPWLESKPPPPEPRSCTPLPTRSESSETP